MGSYARVARPPKLEARAYWLNVGEYEKAKDYAKKEGERVVVTPPEELIKEKEKLQVIYHTESASTGKIEVVSTDEIEECLKEVKGKIVLVERGNAYGTVIAIFNTQEEAKEFGDKILKTEKIMMIPSYDGRKMTKIRIGNIPMKFSVEWVLAGLFKDVDMKIEQVGTTPALNWWGFGVEVWVCSTQEQLEKLPHQIVLNGGRWLNVIVYGRSPICFACRGRSHIKAYCPVKRREETPEIEKEIKKEEENEIEEGEIVLTETEEIYEKISSDSGKFISPKKKRKKQRKQEAKPEQEEKKQVKKSNVKEKNVDMNDTIIIMKNYGKDTEEEKIVHKKKNSFYLTMGSGRELLITKRRFYLESGLNKTYKSEDVVAEVNAGQKIDWETSLEEIMKMKGIFKKNLVELYVRNRVDSEDTEEAEEI